MYSLVFDKGQHKTSNKDINTSRVKRKLFHL